MDFTPEQADKIKDCRKHVKEAEERLKESERSLRLMEAGLKELPLEKDFFELQRFRHKEEERDYQVGKMLIELIDKS
jgi:hypothetical protein